MKIELPTLAPSATPKRRNPAILLLGISTLLVATTCSFYFFSGVNGSPRELFDNRFLTTATTTVSATNGCANGLTALTTGLTQTQINEIVQAHNTFRSTVALGKAPGQPGATDMLEMVWNAGVALRAQAWADQCVFEHDTAADREPTSFSYIGQNIVYMAYSSKTQAANMTTMIEQFYNEVTLYGGKSAPVTSYEFNAATGHYTQLVWGNSYAVGCGLKKYLNGEWYTYLLVCNYGPGGNYLTEKMYTKGTFNAKNCKKGASTTYKGLCIA